MSLRWSIRQEKQKIAFLWGQIGFESDGLGLLALSPRKDAVFPSCSRRINLRFSLTRNLVIPKQPAEQCTWDYLCFGWKVNWIVHTQVCTVFQATIGDKMSFADFKWGEYSFFCPHPLHAMLTAVRATFKKKFKKKQTPQLWMEGTGERCGFFCSLKLPYFVADCRT